MALLLVVAGVLMVARAMRIGSCEVVFGTLLVAPLFAFLIGQIGPVNVPAYLLSLLAGLVLLKWGAGQRVVKDSLTTYLPLLLFSISYVVALGLCYLWPDFTSMGERLRDFALLASQIRDPRAMVEPWLPSAPLHYYVYWYRLGAMFATLTGADFGAAYHQLVAFSFSFFITALYLVGVVVLKLSPIIAAGLALFTAFSSNVAGIVHALGQSDNWWGPSRVIKGAINEFPAWSFLLGDAHPHYLNYGVLPFVLVLVWRLGAAKLHAPLGALMLLSLPFLYNANAWELPALLLLGGLLVVTTVWHYRADILPMSSEGVLPALASLALIGLSLALQLGPVLSSPAGLKPMLVTPDIGYTGGGEFLLHFGIPMVLGLIGLAARFTAQIWIEFTVGVIGLFLFYQFAAFALLPMIAFALLIVLLRRHEEAALVFLFGLLLALVPEILFFNDDYGGDHERMNTIFKFYAVAWWPLHLGAGALFVGAVAPLWRRVSLPIRISLVVPALLLPCAFFAETVSLRASPVAGRDGEGLAGVERLFGGATTTILDLRKEPYGVVLEAQEGAYNMSSHVATLSGHRSYLGWSNHVDLLTKQGDEIRRRRELIMRVYTTPSCEAVKTLLYGERVDYVVVGPLERQQFPELRYEHFNCMPMVTGNGQYRVYRAASGR